jgi:hypothetical protein
VRLVFSEVLLSFLCVSTLTACSASQVVSYATPVITSPPIVTPPPIVAPATVAYHAYGDSITGGVTLGSPTLAYPSLIAQDRKFSLSNYAVGGAQACDLPTVQIFPNGDNPTAGAFPIYTILIGTNDEDTRGPEYFPIFDLCDQASIAWLALPADLKVLASASGVSTSGPGSIETVGGWNGWLTSTLNSSITFPITLAAGGPVYIWPRIADNDAGAFSYAVDGNVLGSFTTSYPGVVIRTSNGIDNSLGFIRIPGIAAGKHTVTLTQTTNSGTMRIVAIGAPPAASRTLPQVVVGDPPLQEVGSVSVCNSNPSICAGYLAQIQANVALFATDGLSVLFVDNHPYMHGTPGEMNDNVHPNALGHSELRTAFETAIP